MEFGKSQTKRFPISKPGNQLGPGYYDTEKAENLLRTQAYSRLIETTSKRFDFQETSEKENDCPNSENSKLDGKSGGLKMQARGSRVSICRSKDRGSSDLSSSALNRRRHTIHPTAVSQTAQLTENEVGRLRRRLREKLHEKEHLVKTVETLNQKLEDNERATGEAIEALEQIRESEVVLTSEVETLQQEREVVDTARRELSTALEKEQQQNTELSSEIKHLRAELARSELLMKQISEKESQINHLEITVETLEAKHNDDTCRLTAVGKELACTNEKLGKTQNKLQEQVEEKELARKQLAIAQQQLQVYEATIGNLERIKGELEVEKGKLMQRIRNDVDTLKVTAKEALRSKLFTELLQRVASATGAEVTKATSRNAYLQDTINDKQRELIEAGDLLAEESEKLNRAKLHTELLACLYRKVTAMLALMKQTADQSSADCALLSLKLSQNEARTTDLCVKYETLLRTSAGYRAAHKGMQLLDRKRESLLKENSETIKDLKCEIANLRKEHDHAIEANQALLKECAKKGDDLSKLRAVVCEKEQELSELRLCRTKLSDSVQTLSIEMQEKAKVFETLEKQNEGLATQVATSEEQVSKLTNHLEATAATLQTAELQNANLVAEVERLTSDSQSLTEAFTTTTQRLALSEAEVLGLKEALEQTRGRMGKAEVLGLKEALEQTRGRMGKAGMEHKQDLLEKEASIATLEARLVTGSENIATLTKELDATSAALQASNATCKEQATAHASKVEHYDKTLKSFRDSLHRARLDKKEIQGALTCAEKEIAARQERLMELQEQAKVISTQHAEHLKAKHNEINELQVSLRQMRVEQEAAQDQFKTRTQAIQNLESEVATLLSKEANLRRLNVLLAKSLRQEKEAGLEAQTALEANSTQLKKTKDSLASVTRQNQHLASRITGFEKDLIQKTEDLSSLKTKERELSARNLSLSQELKADAACWKKQVDGVEEERNHALARNHDLEQNLAGLNKTVHCLEEEVTRTKTLLSEKREELDVITNQKTTLEEQCCEDKRALLDSQARCEQFASQLASLEQQKQGLHDEIEALGSKLSAETTVAVELKAEVTELLSSRDNLTQTVKELTSRCTSFSEEHQAVVAALAAEKIVTKQLQEQYDALHSRQRELETEAEEKMTIINNHETSREKLMNRITGLEQVVAERDSKVVSLEEVAAAVEQRVIELQAQVDVKESQHRMLEERLASAPSTEALEDTVKELKEALETQKHRNEVLAGDFAKIANYEAEIECLQKEGQEKQRLIALEAQRLCEEANKMVGHRNTRQKIKHFQKVKEENLKLKEEVSRLTVRHERDEAKIQKLEALAKRMIFKGSH